MTDNVNPVRLKTTPTNASPTNAGQTNAVQWVIIGALVVMVARSVDWVVNPSADASLARYALNVVTIVVCGATAYATWRPSRGARRVLHTISRRPRE